MPGLCRSVRLVPAIGNFWTAPGLIPPLQQTTATAVKGGSMFRGLLLWMIGIPIPIIILLLIFVR